MPVDKKIAIEHLEEIVKSYEELEKDSFGKVEYSAEARSFILRASNCIEALAPPNSVHMKGYKEAEDSEGERLEYLVDDIVLPVILALRDDYKNNRLISFKEMMNQELLGDFIGMSRHLLNTEGFKLPAAVLAGGALEEHLRHLCQKVGVSTTDSNDRPKKASKLNDDLKHDGAYGQDGAAKNIHKQVTAWLGIRNSAAHNLPDEFTEDQVTLMIDGIEFFLTRYPA